MFKSLIPFLFGTEAAGGQLNLFRLKHTSTPQAQKRLCGDYFRRHGSASTGTRTSGDTLFSHRHQMKWVDLVQTKQLSLEQRSGLFLHLLPSSRLPRWSLLRSLHRNEVYVQLTSVQTAFHVRPRDHTQVFLRAVNRRGSEHGKLSFIVTGVNCLSKRLPYSTHQFTAF